MTDTETGPGVFETALAYTDTCRMADNAALFKLVAKSVGIKYNILPTFMAKPWENVSTRQRTGWWLVRPAASLSGVSICVSCASWTPPRLAPISS